MPRLTAFYIKLQLHFGGDIHEISVSASNGIEPTVTDLMNVLERNLRVPRALQNITYHGQELHTRPSEPLSRFGIRNGVPIRLVGRMVPPDKVDPINTQHGHYSYQHQQPYYTQQLNTMTTYPTYPQTLPYFPEQVNYIRTTSVGTQYDPTLLSIQLNQSFPTLDHVSQQANTDEYSPSTRTNPLNTN